MIIKREFHFEAAHRLPHHGGKCKHLHGHSYRVDVSIESPVDPLTGISVDFGDLKPIGTWIDDNLDHATMVWSGDLVLLSWLHAEGQKRYITDMPPTAEVIAMKVRAEAQRILGDGCNVSSVCVWETANCSAEAS